MTQQMQQVARAFKEFGRLVKIQHHGGRRLVALELASKARVITPERGNAARTAPMAKRAFRRQRASELNTPFRPVYGYLGVPAPDHKLMIAIMRGMEKV